MLSDPAQAGLTLTLPYPISVNHYWVRTRHGGMMISDKGRKYRNAVIGRVLNYRGARSAGPNVPVRVWIESYPPDKRHRDLDNQLKSLLDALQHAGVYQDDYQIWDLRIQRFGLFEGGKVVVHIVACFGGAGSLGGGALATRPHAWIEGRGAGI